MEKSKVAFYIPIFLEARSITEFDNQGAASVMKYCQITLSALAIFPQQGFATEEFDIPSMNTMALQTFIEKGNYKRVSKPNGIPTIYVNNDGEIPEYILVEHSGYDVVDLRLLYDAERGHNNTFTPLTEKFGTPISYAEIVDEVSQYQHSYDDFLRYGINNLCKDIPENDMDEEAKEICESPNDPVAFKKLVRRFASEGRIPSFYCQEVGDKENSPLFYQNQCILELVYPDEVKKDGKLSFARDPKLPAPSIDSEYLSVNESTKGHAEFGHFMAVIWNTGEYFVSHQFTSGGFAGLRDLEGHNEYYYFIRIHQLEGSSSLPKPTTSTASTGFTTTESGLKYRILNGDNSGAKPRKTDKVKVHYEGRLMDGTKFDSSFDRGEPVSFPLDRVIKGWTEGVALMGVGDTFQFQIPPQLAYGDHGSPAIPPNSTLVFDVELIEIIDY